MAWVFPCVYAVSQSSFLEAEMLSRLVATFDTTDDN